MKQGPIEWKIIEQCKREGRPLPSKIQNAPEIKLGLALYYQAFLELTTCRPSGLSVGPIPWAAIREYARVSGFDEVQTDDLVFFIHRMDNAFLVQSQKER